MRKIDERKLRQAVLTWLKEHATDAEYSRYSLLIPEHGVDVAPIAGDESRAVVLVSHWREPLFKIPWSDLESESGTSEGWSTP